MSSGNQSPNQLDHAFALWESIKKAQGFPKGFVKWWRTRTIAWVDSPVDLPQGLPTASQASQVFQNFEAEFRHYEQILKTHRVRQAKEARLKDPSRIYRDIARPPAVPVQTLVTKSSVIVESSSSDHLTFTFAADKFDTNEPVFGPNGIIRCQSHTPGTIVLPDDQGLGVGDLLTQSKLCGSLTSVFEEFEKHWGSIWNKHSSTDDSRWNDFIDTALEVLPKPETPFEATPLTVEIWLNAVRHKKVHSATGPDGIARADLLSMPLQCTRELVSLINEVELGQPWPSQVQVGLVSALEKRELSQSVSDYRPICVLSFAYRVWSSIRTKQLLQWLNDITPDSLIGSRPRKEAAHVWFHLASLVEDLAYEDHQITGLSVDIQRCFNELPRTPVFAIAAALDISPRIWVPWQNHEGMVAS